MAKPIILIIEDDESIRNQMRWAFSRDYEVLEAGDRNSAIEMVKTRPPKVVILDLGLPPKARDASEGLKALQEILEIDPIIKVLMVTGNTEKENALKAIQLGAFDFFTKPVDLDEVQVTVKRACHVANLERENIVLRKELETEGLGEMLGTSAPIQEVFTTIRKVATVDVPVLILGETGTGKELAARAIHRLSNRGNGPFVVINCGAIPENLLESELFGHEKGAFTGANTMRKGRIEYSEGGTLFLDEIGELSPLLQVKLLRFLQEHTIERVGGRESISVDVRVIVATNRDLNSAVKSGEFREDLYFRLGVVTLIIPPLQERDDDVYILALAFLRRYSREFNINIRGFRESAISVIRSYSWPGNIRELENKVKGAVAMCQGGEISPEDLALPSSEYGKSREEEVKKVVTLLAGREVFEKRMVHEALLKHKGVVSRAALELGISRQYLSNLLVKYDIKPKTGS
jgi:two-component system NtrC family response regulator